MILPINGVTDVYSIDAWMTRSKNSPTELQGICIDPGSARREGQPRQSEHGNRRPYEPERATLKGEWLIDEAQAAKCNYRNKPVRMRVKRNYRHENEKQAVADRLHLKKNPEEPANEEHVERVVAALSGIKEELNRKE